jgi:hypothetical protein
MFVRLPVGPHVSSQEIAEVFFIKTGIVDGVHTKNCANLILVRTLQHIGLYEA